MAHPDSEARDAFHDLLEAFQGQDDARRARLMERLYRVCQDDDREQRGLDPLPPLPYNDLDRENDVHLLTATLPQLRAGPGWNGAEAAMLIDRWEGQALQRLQSYGKEMHD